MNTNDSVKEGASRGIGQHEYEPTTPYNGCARCGVGPGALIHNMTYTPPSELEILAQKLKLLIRNVPKGGVQFEIQVRHKLVGVGGEWESIAMDGIVSTERGGRYTKHLLDSVEDAVRVYATWSGSSSYNLTDNFDVRIVPVLTALAVSMDEASSQIDTGCLEVWYRRGEQGTQVPTLGTVVCHVCHSVVDNPSRGEREESVHYGCKVWSESENGSTSPGWA